MDILAERARVAAPCRDPSNAAKAESFGGGGACLQLNRKGLAEWNVAREEWESRNRDGVIWHGRKSDGSGSLQTGYLAAT